MGRFRVYLTPIEGIEIDNTATYRDEIEITRDVLKLGNISLTLDNNEYDLGLQKTANVKIQLRNDHGKYGPPETTATVFGKQVNESKIRITWDEATQLFQAGFFDIPLGAPDSLEVDIFNGILNDITLGSKISDQTVDFTCLGLEHALTFEDVPFSTFTDDVSTFSDIVLGSLDQTRITNLITVLSGNISVDNDIVIDTKAPLENQTVRQAFKDILLAANSIIYIDGTTVIVSPRTETVDLKQTFYGQAAEDGIENIIDIAKYRGGENRVKNRWLYSGTTLTANDITSRRLHGIREKEISLDIITTASRQQAILDRNLREFRNKKIEFLLETPLTYETLSRKFLDKVQVDYPTILVPTEGNEFFLYDSDAEYDDDARYAFEFSSLTIPKELRFKILSKKIVTSTQMMVFGLREIGF